jgi:hypothetical protein
MRIAQRLFSALLLVAVFATGVLAQANGDYQTTKTGNWNDPTVWQVFNGSWGPASASPDTNAGKVTVLAPHIVTVTANATVDSVYVSDGASVVVNSGVTMTINYNNNLPGLVLQGINALQVSGILKNEGNIIGAVADRNVDFDPGLDTAVFRSGGVYNHARNAGIPIVAKWEDGSTFLMTGIKGNYPTRKSQNFYNFTWNCPEQSRSDGQVNFYRTRVRGDITILSNGTVWGHDRDIRMCDNFPTRTAQYSDTVWVDGNIYVRKAPPGQYSRLAINGGGNTNVTAVVIIKGNVVVEDSCVFGRSNSQTDIQVEIGGDLIVSGGGMIYNGSNNPYMMKNIVFTKKGTAKLTLGDGQGSFNRGATVVGPQNWIVRSGCTLDMGTSKIDTLDTGFFMIENGGAVTATYGANSAKLACKGQQGIVDLDHDSIGTVLTANGNSLASVNNVVGAGTITYAASAMQNVSDPGKAITRRWTVTPSAGITSADLVLSYSPYDIPATASEKQFVSMKYAGTGTSWQNKGPVAFTIDPVFGDTIFTHSATLTNVTDLSGVWSVGAATITGVESESPSTVPLEFFVDQNYPNPFNPTTTIRFGLPEAAQVDVTVFDVLGREVASVLSEQRPAGIHVVSFDASQFSSGVYVYRVKAGDRVDAKRMVLVR